MACSALTNGICTNGFPETPACKSDRMGHFYAVPPCLSEKRSALLFPETGAPSRELVARARKRAALGQEA